jgi:hypothetical protein
MPSILFFIDEAKASYLLGIMLKMYFTFPLKYFYIPSYYTEYKSFLLFILLNFIIHICFLYKIHSTENSVKYWDMETTEVTFIQDKNVPSKVFHRIHFGYVCLLSLCWSVSI